MNRVRSFVAAALFPFVTASAHAQSSINIYGIVDACTALSDRGTTSVKLVNSGCQNGTRLGFRGQEDLGEGSSAYFQLEQGFNVDDGVLGQGGRSFGRKAIVGLSSKTLGSIELGRDYTPVFYLLSPTDPMGLGLGTVSSTISTGANPTTSGRNDNALNYITPAFGPVSARVHYSLGEQAAPAASRGRDTVGASVMWRDSRWTGGVAHASHRNAADSDRDSATTAALMYNFGGFRVSGAFQTGKWEGSRTPAAPASTTSLFSRAYRSYMVGGVAAVGASGRIAFSLKHYDDRTVLNYDATQWSVLGSYAFSKRTDVYAGYSRLRNASGSAYAIADGTTTYSGVTVGATTSLLALGIRHYF